jgi:predicted nucleic acid-binding protein
MSLPDAFWDTSALLPLCVLQPQTAAAISLTGRYQIVAWWAAEVELLSGLTRLRRMGMIDSGQFDGGKLHAERLVRSWFSIHESKSITAAACSLLELYSLRAADALRLAASLEACQRQPAQYVFITGDQRQADAARQTGFTVEFV